MTQKVASFWWDQEEEKILQQLSVIVQASLPFQPYDSVDPGELKVSVADRPAVGILGRPL